MQNQFSRTQLLLGKPAIDTLNGSRVAVLSYGNIRPSIYPTMLTNSTSHTMTMSLIASIL